MYSNLYIAQEEYVTLTNTMLYIVVAFESKHNIEKKVYNGRSLLYAFLKELARFYSLKSV